MYCEGFMLKFKSIFIALLIALSLALAACSSDDTAVTPTADSPTAGETEGGGPSPELSDPAENANLLTDTYTTYYRTRSI